MQRPALGSFNRSPTAASSAEQRARVQTGRVRLASLAEALVAALRGFSAAPGRKAVLLLSGRWNPDLATDTTDPLSNLSRQAVDLANLLGYSIYPLDTERRSIPFFDAEQERPRPEFDSRRATELVFPFADLAVESDRISRLRRLATETGGRWLGDRDRALGTILADSRSFYWLGYEPDRLHDDSIHRLEVRRAIRSSWHAIAVVFVTSRSTPNST